MDYDKESMQTAASGIYRYLNAERTCKMLLAGVYIGAVQESSSFSSISLSSAVTAQPLREC